MKFAPRWGIFLLCVLPAVLHGHGSQGPLPKDFAPVGVPQRYGPPEQKLAAGSIFDYMDGGGIVYLEHGFRELVHGEFLDPRGRRITFDRFTMATPVQARAALADERIAPAGGKSMPLDAPNKGYMFPPDYFIYMVLGKSLIYLHVDDDAMAETLDRFAVDIIAFAKEEK